MGEAVVRSRIFGRTAASARSASAPRRSAGAGARSTRATPSPRSTPASPSSTPPTSMGIAAELDLASIGARSSAWQKPPGGAAESAKDTNSDDRRSRLRPRQGSRSHGTGRISRCSAKPPILLSGSARKGRLSAGNFCLGRIARLQGSSREGPEFAPKPSFHCEGGAGFHRTKRSPHRVRMMVTTRRHPLQ